ncbi:MAG: AAA family ATPase [Desulforudis sp.]|jgi:dephospho-CoA kinase|nr:MAG: AAA family ATPase [Desulforudis sp.]
MVITRNTKYWHNFIKTELCLALEPNQYWFKYIKHIINDNVPYAIHLAIFVEPYLQYILEDKKTVESRFSRNRIAPYNRIFTNDVILLKRSSGPIVGICQADNVWSYKLDPKSWSEIRGEFAQMLCAQDPSFWDQRKNAEYATLIRLKHVCPIPALNFIKTDRRGWVIMKERNNQLKLKSNTGKKNIILCFAGGIASGKSTLSSAVSDILKWPRVSFGDYVREVAKKRGVPGAREVLQDIGLELLKDTDQFCLDVLRQAHWKPGGNIIIDGVRHLSVLRSLDKLDKNAKVILIFADTAKEVREKRFNKRNEVNNSKLSLVEKHPTEKDVNSELIKSADFVVNGSAPLNDLSKTIIGWIKENVV